VSLVIETEAEKEMGKGWSGRDWGGRCRGKGER